MTRKKIKCPICLDKYYSIYLADEVCAEHQKWIVTTCEKCGKSCFSDCRGVCINCCPTTADRYLVPGKPDPRAILRSYGLESFD